jgi:hypothetical protein
MITPAKMVFGIICAVLCGLVFFFEAFHIFVVRNAPIVTGHVVARQPIREFSVPRVDFTIRIEGTDTTVHAHAQRYLMSRVPETVRFHYNRDPNREVFLFEHEENPYWIVLTCWGLALALTVCMRSPRIRRMLGWKERTTEARAA